MPWPQAHAAAHVPAALKTIAWVAASKFTLGIGSVLLAVNEIVNWSRGDVIGLMGLVALGAGGLLRGYRMFRDERRAQQVKDDEAFKPSLRKQLAESKAEHRKLKLEFLRLERKLAEAEADRDDLHARVKELLGIKRAGAPDP